MPDKFLTVKEVAERLLLNQQTVRNLIDRGTIPAVHVGRRVRIPQADFDRYLRAVSTGEIEKPRSAKPEAELLSQRQLAQALGRSHDWVNARVRDGMPFEPPAEGVRHPRFRLADVAVWLAHRDNPDPRDGPDPAETVDQVQAAELQDLERALTTAAEDAHDEDLSALADSLRAVARAAERIADAVERAGG